MTNPQLTKNLLEVIRSLPVEDRRWLLEQLGDLSSLIPQCCQLRPQLLIFGSQLL